MNHPPEECVLLHLLVPCLAVSLIADPLDQLLGNLQLALLRGFVT